MSENVFRMNDPNLPILTLIVKSLGDLCESLVFVGGCATPTPDDAASPGDPGYPGC